MGHLNSTLKFSGNFKFPLNGIAARKRCRALKTPAGWPTIQTSKAAKHTTTATAEMAFNKQLPYSQLRMATINM